MGKWWIWIYCVLALAGFSVLAVLAYQMPYLPFDPVITLGVQAFHPDWWTFLMTAVSWPGYMPQAALVVAVLVGLFYAAGYRRAALVAVASTVSAEILDFVIKMAIHQPRPSPDLVHVARILTSYSFPSGHVMFFTSFYAFLWFVSLKVLKPSLLRTFLLVLFGAMVVLVGVSRIYLGEHWFSDVIGAYLLGSVILLIAIRLARLPSKVTLESI
jgi:membrane-associated phospholipid phosphatase